MTYLKIITGANDFYILTLLDFIRSFISLNLNPAMLIVYDLGLNVNSVHYQELLKFRKHYNFIFKKFDYSIYPEHVDLTKYNGLGCSYAFKPIIIYNEANCAENSGDVLIWLDSANRFNIDVLNQIYNLVKKNGIYSPISNRAGSIESIELNHRDTTELFGLSIDEHHNLLNSVSGNLIGFDYSMDAGKKIIDEWYEKSLLKVFIVPEGSSRNNHRQDQTLLSVIIYLYEKHNNVRFDKQAVSGISFWNKKDPNTVQHGYFPFKLIDKKTGRQLAIIYCKTLEEAIRTYANRKHIDYSLFTHYFNVSE
jgi:hypothetical protein